MYLMDEIAATAFKVTPDDWAEPILRIFPDLVERMRATPRFLLDEHVIRAAIELSLGRPTVFREAMRHLRVPHKRLWVEWQETSRDTLRRRLQEDKKEPDPLRPIPERLGFLVEAEPGGRRGVVTWAWTFSEQEQQEKGMLGFPNIAPYEVHFDLDATIPQASALEAGLSVAGLARMWQDNPVQAEALRDVWRTAEHRPSAWGKYLLSRYDAQTQRFFLADIYGEYIGIWAILLLLTASRPTVEYRPVSRAKLNKARKGKPALMDHTEVTMHITHKVASQVQRAPLGYLRKPPRIHLVSSYLARRGDKHWLVNSYTRGSGTTVERHVRVTR
jgi:hypothetical protein